MVSVLLSFVHLCISHGPQAACKFRSVTVRNDPMLLRLVRMCCKSRQRGGQNQTEVDTKAIHVLCVWEWERNKIMCVQVCMHVLLHTSSRERVVSLHDVLRPVSQCLNSVFPSYVYVNEKKKSLNQWLYLNKKYLENCFIRYGKKCGKEVWEIRDFSDVKSLVSVFVSASLP